MSSLQTDLLAQFLADLTLDGCTIQGGAVDRVDIHLTAANYRTYLDAHQAENLYLLADVPAAVGLQRASDKDIPRKHYIYLDFDVRKFLEKCGEECSDGLLKEIAMGLLHSLNVDPLLARWRYCAFTGNGVHVYYIGDPVAIQSLDHWKDGMRKLFAKAEQITGFPLDMSCCNPSKLSRVPGSRNMKDDRPIQTEILEYKDATFDLSLIEKWGNTSNDGKAAPATNAGQSLSATVPEGSRNTTLTSIAGTLHRRGLDEPTLFAALQSINDRMCKPPLPEREVRQIAKSMERYQVSTPLTPSQQSSSTAVTICLADVVSEPVEWLWVNRIPKGKLTIIEGDPGKGKTWCSLAIACAVTLGRPLPGDEERAVQIAPGNVLLLSAEDGPADTIRPRLEDMGADLSRVHLLTAIRNGKGEERHVSLVDDLKEVEGKLAIGKYALVIIDPLNAYLGIKCDTNNDAAMRGVLTPLTQLAAKYGVALICIRHLTKSSRDQAIYRGQGSIAYTAAARAVHLVGVDPDNESIRVIVCIKNSLALLPKAFGFEIREAQFRWTGVSEVTADSLLGSPGSRGSGHPALDEAIEFLRDILADGERLIREVVSEAEAAGISTAALKRAKNALGIKSRKVEGYGAEGGWGWSLPGKTEATVSLNEDH